MAPRWTAEQVADLAPDAATSSRARKLGAGHRWSELGRDDRAVWGQLRGSGNRPYEVAIDREGPAFTCSCPSRKRPCKHAIGLAFVDAAEQRDDTILDQRRFHQRHLLRGVDGLVHGVGHEFLQLLASSGMSLPQSRQRVQTRAPLELGAVPRDEM